MKFFKAALLLATVSLGLKQALRAQTLCTSSYPLPPGCDMECTVAKSGGDFDTIQAAVDDVGANLNPVSGNVCIVIRDAQAYAEEVTVQGFDVNPDSRLTIMGHPSMTSTAAVVSPPADSNTAFNIISDSVTLYNLTISAVAPISYGISIQSYYAVVSSINITGEITTAGIYINGGWAQVSYASVTLQDCYGMYLDGAAYNEISHSMTQVNSATWYALYLYNASVNTVDDVYVLNESGDAAHLETNSNNNTLSRSTFTSDMAVASLYLNESSSNAITYVYVMSENGDAFHMETGSNNNTISQSTFTCGACDTIFYLSQTSSNNITGIYILSENGNGLWMTGSANNTVSQSTVIGRAQYGFYVDQGSSNTIENSYIEGPVAVWIVHSSDTVLKSNLIIGPNGGDTGVKLSYKDPSDVPSGPNHNFSASGNTILPGSGGYGILIDAGNNGNINLSTNTILTGGRYAVYIAAQAGDARVWVTSNTILPTLSASNDTYGIYLNGLTSGATIQNNGIYYRTSGSMGTAPAYTSYAIYAAGASRLAIDHNRINNPGMVTAGNWQGVYFTGTTDSRFNFNDINSTGTNLATVYLLQLKNASTAVQVMGNIFRSSISVTGVNASSAIIVVDAASQTGLVSQYNDFFTPNGYGTAVCAGTANRLRPGWMCNGSQDGGSIMADPYWLDPGVNVEDFHPKTTVANGRWHDGGFSASDNVFSLTIDSAGRSQSYTGGPLGSEPGPNGSRANQGSYGGTAQASKSRVKSGGGFAASD